MVCSVTDMEKNIPECQMPRFVDYYILSSLEMPDTIIWSQ